jgi:hypothetical protein
MHQPVRVEGVGAEVLEHLPDDALANGDVPRETDHVFVRPVTHGATFLGFFTRNRSKRRADSVSLSHFVRFNDNITGIKLQISRRGRFPWS